MAFALDLHLGVEEETETLMSQSCYLDISLCHSLLRAAPRVMRSFPLKLGFHK